MDLNSEPVNPSAHVKQEKGVVKDPAARARRNQLRILRRSQRTLKRRGRNRLK